MSRRNASRAAQTQPPPRSNRVNGNGGRRNLTQPTINEVLNEVAPGGENIEEQVNDVVRYIVYRAGHNGLFRKNDIIKNALGQGTNANFNAIMERVPQVLEDKFGLKLVLCEANATKKCYVVTNSLSHVPDDEDVDEFGHPKDSRKILLMLALTHIFMSGGKVNENSLYAFFHNLGIDVEGNHPLFGKVKEYLMQSLVSEKYLQTETDTITGRLIFYWGIRAEVEISKHKLLEFVCKMYKGGTPQSWSDQYSEASKQSLEASDASNEP